MERRSWVVESNDRMEPWTLYGTLAEAKRECARLVRSGAAQTVRLYRDLSSECIGLWEAVA